MLVISNLQSKKNVQTKDFITLEDYEKLKNYRFGYTTYAKAIIDNVLYPGMYLIEMQIVEIKVYKKNKKPIEIDKSLYQNKYIKIALSLPIKDLWKDCSLELYFYGKRYFYPIEPKNDFFKYLIEKQAQYYLKLEEKNILIKSCPTSLYNESKNQILELIKSKIHNDDARNLLIGLLFGNSNWMEKESKNKIKKLGLLHLFAASGLHLGILFYVFYLPLSKILGKKHILSFLIPLPFLLLYLWILDFPFTLLRAYIFLVIISLLLIIKRKLNIYDLLLNTLLIMILIFPLSVFNLSTIMSFLAISGILLVFNDLNKIFIYQNLFPSYNIKENIKNSLYNFLLIQFLITFTASFLLQPLLFFVFKGYSLFSPMYNMIFVPIISIFLPFIFIVLLFSLIFKAMTLLESFFDILWKFIDIGLNILLIMINKFYHYSLWIEFSNSVNFGFMISILLILIVFILIYYYKQKKIDTNQFKLYFFVVYIIYQLSLFLIYGIFLFK